MRALIVLLWRASLRISEALALAESDLDALHGSVLVRRGKGGTGQFRASSNKAVSDPSLEHSCLQLSALGSYRSCLDRRGTSAATSPRVDGRT
jgi:integrase